jgi:hypothetical protein
MLKLKSALTVRFNQKVSISKSHCVISLASFLLIYQFNNISLDSDSGLSIRDDILIHQIFLHTKSSFYNFEWRLLRYLASSSGSWIIFFLFLFFSLQNLQNNFKKGQRMMLLDPTRNAYFVTHLNF